MKWATPAAGGTLWSIINSGGTTLNGNSSVTISSISGANQLMILIVGATNNGNDAESRLRFNADTGSNYYCFGGDLVSKSTYNGNALTEAITTPARTSIDMGYNGAAANVTTGYLMVSGGNGAGVKMFNGNSVATFNGGSESHSKIAQGGYYDSASTISSVNISCSAGTFDGGTIYVYKA